MPRSLRGSFTLKPLVIDVKAGISEGEMLRSQSNNNTAITDPFHTTGQTDVKPVGLGLGSHTPTHPPIPDHFEQKNSSNNVSPI